MNDTKHTEAQTSLEEGNFKRTLELTEAGLKENDNDAELLHLGAVAAIQLGDTQKSLEFIERAVTIDSENPKIYNSYGNILLRTHDYSHAIKAFETALQLKPDYPAAYNNLGNAYFHEEFFTKAKEAYENAIKYKEDYAEAYFNLARIDIVSNQWKKAEDHLIKAIELDSQHSRALSQLGQIYLHQSKWTDAKIAFEKALSIDSNQANSLAAMGTIELQDEHFDAAIDYLEKALKLNDKILNANWHLATAYLAKGDTHNALKHYMREIIIEPNVDCYFNIGVLKSYENHFKEAIDYLEHALKMDPHYLAAHLNLAAIYLKTQETPKAIEHYELALRIKPESAEIKHVLHALKQDRNPQKAPKEFISHLFDQYSPHYDVHLTQNLKFQVPQLIGDAFARHTNDKSQLKALDLGCGTGLSADPIKKFTSELIGIDLSQNMVEIARAKNIYSSLEVMDVEAALDKYQHLDVIIAGDVFTYIGDLDKIFAKARRALNNNGIFIFTVERGVNKGFHLTKNVRYQHHEDYIKGLANDHHFKTLEFKPCILRKQFDKEVKGYIVTLQK